MKKCLLFVYCFFTGIVFLKAQNTDESVLHLKQMPITGVVLIQGWKFNAGDDLNWSRPDFNDHNWQAVDPTGDIHDLPQIHRGRGWFRLKLKLDSSLLAHSLAISIYQSGAAEIYLNGKLLQRYGTMGANPERVIAYDPLGKPMSVQFAISG